MSVFGGASLQGLVGKVRALLFQLWYTVGLEAGGWRGGVVGVRGCLPGLTAGTEKAAPGVVAQAPAADPGSRQ